MSGYLLCNSNYSIAFAPYVDSLKKKKKLYPALLHPVKKSCVLPWQVVKQDNVFYLTSMNEQDLFFNIKISLAYKNQNPTFQKIDYGAFNYYFLEKNFLLFFEILLFNFFLSISSFNVLLILNYSSLFILIFFL